MEHLNRRLKKAIRNVGSNIYPMVIQRAAKSLGPVSTVMDQFEQETDIYMKTKITIRFHHLPET